MTFADWLRDQMDRRSLSIAGLGKAVGASKSTVFDWRKGRSEPVTETRSRLAAFFGVPAQELASRMRRPGE